MAYYLEQISQKDLSPQDYEFGNELVSEYIKPYLAYGFDQPFNSFNQEKLNRNYYTDEGEDVYLKEKGKSTSENFHLEHQKNGKDISKKEKKKRLRNSLKT